MSSNLILKDGIIEKTIDKKTCKRKGIAKKGTRLKSDRKKIQWGWNLNKNKYSKQKKFAIKRIRAKLERLKIIIGGEIENHL